MMTTQPFMSEKQFYHEMSVQGWSIGYCGLEGLGYTFYLQRGSTLIIPSKTAGFQIISESVFDPYRNNGWILPLEIQRRLNSNTITSGDFYFLCHITKYYEHARQAHERRANEGGE